MVARHDGPAAVAATFTTNRLPAAAVHMNKAHLQRTAPDGEGRYGWVEAMMSTSGCANAATGAAGLADQRSLAATLAAAAGTQLERVLAMSTGPHRHAPAGRARRLARWRRDRRPAPRRCCLRRGGRSPAHDRFAGQGRRGHASSCPAADGSPVAVTVSGVAKGVGIDPSQHGHDAQLRAHRCRRFTRDAQPLLRPIVARTWNQTSVDGDQSTNDTVLLVASGASGAAPAEDDPEALATSDRAVEAVARSLARQQAADGEGAATLITCAVSGAADDAAARAAARAVVSSDLLKAAVHGADPNWGRIAMAVGNAVIAPSPVLEAAGLAPPTAAARAGQPVELEADRTAASTSRARPSSPACRSNTTKPL